MRIDKNNSSKIINSISEFVFVFDINGSILEVNNAVVDVLGYNKSELLGKLITIAHPPEYEDSIKNLLPKIVSGECDVCPYPLLTKKGDYIPVKAKVNQGEINNKKVFIKICRNLSEMAISNEKFYRVFENNHALMMISGMDTGICINANKEFLKTLGYEKHEAVGYSAMELNIYDDHKRINEFVEKIKSNELVENEYLTFRTKEGKPIHCLCSMTSIKIKSYKFLLTSAVNISPLKEIETKLKSSLIRQTILADISQSFLSIDNLSKKINHTLDLIGNHIDVSRVYIFEDSYKGKEASNTYEWCNTDINPQIDILQNVPYEIIPSWKKILNEKGKIFSNNIKNLPNDVVAILEPQKIKSILVFPIMVQNYFFGFIGFDECIKEKHWQNDEVDLLRSIAGIISNSFERQLYQKQFKEYDIRQKLAFENTGVGLWDWNIKTGSIFVNDNWFKMIGYTRDELVPKISNWQKLVHPMDMPFVMKNLNEHLDGKCYSYENKHRLLTKSGDWKWVLDKGKVIEYDTNNKPLRVIGTHLDINEITKYQNQLEDYAHIVSHDLKSPLRSINALIAWIKEDNQGNLNEATLTNFNLIDDVLHQMENLISSILEHSKIDYKLSKKNDVDLNILLNEIKKVIFIPENITLKIQDKLPVLHCEKTRISQIFQNIIDNAVKYNNRERGEIVINFTETISHYQFSVKDNGKGINQKYHDKIFEIFQTLETNKNSSGIGLYIVKKQVNYLEGKIWVESKENIGSTFYFTIKKEL